MSTPQILYPLPPGVHVSKTATLDHRPTPHLIEELHTYRPIRTTKNIWCFWHSGFQSMRGWNKRNVLSWIRKLGPSWEVRVLDRVAGSPNNIYNYLSPSDFPLAFNEQTMKGPYVGAHSADLVRLPLIYKYGGVWLDVSILLFRHIDEICWNVLDDPNSKFEMAGFSLPGCHGKHQIPYGYMENWFIASARIHNPFIERWYAVFNEYWSDKQESHGVKEHPLFAHLDTDGYRQDMLDYLAQHASFQRVRTTIDKATGWHGPEWHREKVYLLDARSEGYYLPEVTKWKGQLAFDLISQHRPHQKFHDDSVERSQAETIFTHIVANSCLIKNVHGFKGDTQLACIWNRPENADCDHEPGTYAEFLREASAHYVQNRLLKRLVVAEDHTEKYLYAGILQPAVEVSELEHCTSKDINRGHPDKKGGLTHQDYTDTTRINYDMHHELEVLDAGIQIPA